MQAPSELDTRSVLLRMLADSLRKGYWRVACRRYLMLRACGWPVPEDVRATCEANLLRCTPLERQRMRQDAQAWARARWCQRQAVEATGPKLREAEAARPSIPRASPSARPGPVRRAARRVAQEAAPAASAASAPSQRTNQDTGAIRTQWRPLPSVFVQGSR